MSGLTSRTGSVKRVNYPAAIRTGSSSVSLPSATAGCGLQAVDYADAGKRAPESWVREQCAFLEDAAKPRAELLIAIVPSIEKLLDRAATATPR